MDQLDSMRVFVAVADAQSFAGAARSLKCSPAAVTRAVAALEQHLGARLLHRTTRSLRLSEAGERYVADCRRILAELDEADAVASGAHVDPQGELKITAPVLFGRIHMAPLLLDFLKEHPRLSARAMFVDRLVHLIDEGVDVALRIAHLPDSSLTALKVGTVRRVIVASPHYLARQGEPLSPDDLAQHDAIGISTSGGSSTPWQFARPGAAHRDLHPAPAPRVQLTVNASEVAILAAKSGHGLIRTLSYQVAEDVARGHLRIVLADFEPTPVPVHLVHPEGRHAAAKVRAFLDFAAARLRAHPALNDVDPPRAQ
ncbi:MAG: LysR family transcriptional regulator [Leptothrix sp. (in: Bacteria)]|nr:LysR family transcriptional regulator [Leptothrix sp. (in: b-proteobacteria)]